ncbi:MAG TPA: carboxypeptidase-like regulatory domain-containing protein, partial [Flavisolibacter sp.]|nr:carboxypeptidase-like regulatory domain-containing protein [Flavisolibacter sp.]
MAKRLALLRYAIATAFVVFLSLFSFSQNFSVTGRAIDNNGQPVEGVTVQERGTQNVTVTKKDGTFSLRTASGNATLILSSVGYERQEIAVGNQANITINLRTAANALNEVVVVGYGT